MQCKQIYQRNLMLGWCFLFCFYYRGVIILFHNCFVAVDKVMKSGFVCKFCEEFVDFLNNVTTNNNTLVSPYTVYRRIATFSIGRLLGANNTCAYTKNLNNITRKSSISYSSRGVRKCGQRLGSSSHTNMHT